MARKAGGVTSLEAAKACLVRAKTVAELRQAQAVVLPLECGLSLKQTAQVIGVSVGWACQLRTRFMRGEGVPGQGPRRRGGRRRENMTAAQEAAFLVPFFEKAKAGGVLVVGPIKQALDAHLGRNVPLSSVYNLLHRHGWRKLAPDKRHPKADVAAQEDWKKNSQTSCSKSTGSGKATGRSVMFQDEARFGRISDTRRCWCPKPVRPLCSAMVTQEYTYAYAAVSAADGRARHPDPTPRQRHMHAAFSWRSGKATPQ